MKIFESRIQRKRPITSIEREILSKKVYYKKSHTQTHKEIRLFEVCNTVSSNTIDVKFCLNHNRTDSIDWQEEETKKLKI